MSLGIVIDRHLLRAHPYWWWVISVLSVVIWFAMRRLGGYGQALRGDTTNPCSRAARIRTLQVLLVLLSITALGAARHASAWSYRPAQHVVFSAATARHAVPTQPVVIRLQVCSTPTATELPPENPLATVPVGVTTRFVGRARAIRNGESWQDATGLLRVRLEGQLPGVYQGDTCIVSGHLMLLPEPNNPGETDIGLIDRTDGILARLEVDYPDCVQLVERPVWGWGRQMGRIRRAARRTLHRYVGGPQADLASAMLLGTRQAISPDVTEPFFLTGTMHLLAISGLHVGIMAWAFLWYARSGTCRQLVLILLLFLTVFYAALTGLRAPVLRASLLVQIVCCGLLWRRKVPAYNALGTAALAVLIYRPADLFRPGAQLSFLAVIVLVWMAANRVPPAEPPVDRLIRQSARGPFRLFQDMRQRLYQLAIAGGAIWLVALPWSMHLFHLASPVALALNVVLSVPTAWALLSGMLVVLTGHWFPTFAAICGQQCGTSLSCLETAVRWGQALPGAYQWVVGPSAEWAAVYYMALLALAVLPKRLRPGRLGAVTLFVGWLAMPILAGRYHAVGSQHDWRCMFLSVGHGTAAVVETPQGQVLVYDAGRMGVPAPGVRIVSEYLWHRGINHIDAIVLSHADADHYNLVPGLLKRFGVTQIFVSPYMFERSAGSVRVLQDAIQQHQVPLRTLQAGDRFTLDATGQQEIGGRVREPESSTQVRVLHPPAVHAEGTDNAKSIVLELRYGGRCVLLPGDLEAEGLFRLMATPSRDCDVLMAPHHGSPRSLPHEICRWCQPECVVISAGQHTAPSSIIANYESNDRQVWHTGVHGAVLVNVDTHGTLTVDSWRRGSPRDRSTTPFSTQ